MLLFLTTWVSGRGISGPSFVTYAIFGIVVPYLYTSVLARKPSQSLADFYNCSYTHPPVRGFLHWCRVVVVEYLRVIFRQICHFWNISPIPI